MLWRSRAASDGRRDCFWWSSLCCSTPFILQCSNSNSNSSSRALRWWWWGNIVLSKMSYSKSVAKDSRTVALILTYLFLIIVVQWPDRKKDFWLLTNKFDPCFCLVSLLSSKDVVLRHVVVSRCASSNVSPISYLCYCNKSIALDVAEDEDDGQWVFAICKINNHLLILE